MQCCDQGSVLGSREETIETGDISGNSPLLALTPLQERQRWMAAAETWVPGATPFQAGLFPLPLWADDQFHILEMQTPRPAPSASAGVQTGSTMPLDARRVFCSQRADICCCRRLLLRSVHSCMKMGKQARSQTCALS